MLINYSNSTYSTPENTKRVSGNQIFTLAVAIACAIYIFVVPGAPVKQTSPSAAIQLEMSVQND